MTCERCDKPAFPGRGYCADHLLESLGLEHGCEPGGDMERAMDRQCIARRRDGARCRGRYANRETKLCTRHHKLLDSEVDLEDVLRGDLPKEHTYAGPDSKLPPVKRIEAVLAEKPSGNGTPSVLADVDLSEEEHGRVKATVGDILREARASSREAIEETVALLLDARRTVNVVVPPGAVPGQTISVQVPDLKLRLDGLKFVSERVEGRAVEARSTTSSGNYPMPTTLAEWERLPFKWKFAFIAVHELPGIERLIEDGSPDDWEALRKNDVRVESLRWIVGELDNMQRRAALT